MMKEQRKENAILQLSGKREWPHCWIAGRINDLGAVSVYLSIWRT